MSPPVYRRAISREDNNDVFARLGAGQSDPTPGGTIRELAGKVRLILYKNFIIFVYSIIRTSLFSSIQSKYLLTLVWTVPRPAVHGSLNVNPPYDTTPTNFKMYPSDLITSGFPASP